MAAGSAYSDFLRLIAFLQDEHASLYLTHVFIRRILLDFLFRLRTWRLRRAKEYLDVLLEVRDLVSK